MLNAEIGGIVCKWILAGLKHIAVKVIEEASIKKYESRLKQLCSMNQNRDHTFPVFGLLGKSVPGCICGFCL